MTDTDTAPTVRFAEPGARWRSIAYGPLLCLVILILELIVRRGGVHWFGLGFCALLLAGFVALQVVAGRRHVSVELTDTSLREGAETISLDSIATIFPEHDEESWEDEDWQSARALGELTGVPRRRKGIGLKLRDGGLVQAWAKDHLRLREELTAALEELPGRGEVGPGGAGLRDPERRDLDSGDTENRDRESGDSGPSRPGDDSEEASPEGGGSEHDEPQALTLDDEEPAR